MRVRMNADGGRLALGPARSPDWTVSPVRCSRRTPLLCVPRTVVSERTFCVIATESPHFILTGDIWNGDGVVDATDEMVRTTG